MTHLLAITITLLPSTVLAQQFTPEQMLDVMTKSPSNRDVRVQDYMNTGATDKAYGLDSGNDPDKLSAYITLGDVLLNIVGDSLNPLPFGQINR